MNFIYQNELRDSQIPVYLLSVRRLVGCFLYALKEVIFPDLCISRRLHRLFGQWPRRGYAHVLHRDRNAERRVGADAGARHRQARQMDSAFRGLHPSCACACRHDSQRRSGGAAVPDQHLRRADL